MWQSRESWVGAGSAERSWRAFKSLFAINVAKQGIFACCPETPLKHLVINVAKQSVVVHPGGDPFESFYAVSVATQGL
jgi:hypothetical protein